MPTCDSKLVLGESAFTPTLILKYSFQDVVCDAMSASRDYGRKELTNLFAYSYIYAPMNCMVVNLLY